MEQIQPSSSNLTGRSQDDSGKYEILRVVNRGGMGEIALGRVKGSKGFEKLVILKRLRADAERDDHRQMFDVEAELMSRIEHPNIVQVFDQPLIGGVQYLAMAYVRGRNLDQILRRIRRSKEKLALQLTLTVAQEVLRGLAFVHRLKDGQGRALGVVHQDITPSNVLISFFGEVKITDFGIAYVTSRDGGRRQGVLKGKPRYVAPEVLAGRRVNNKADLYGVAVVLFELFTGRPLFARLTVDETLTAVARNDLPDFMKDLSHVPKEVHEILRRALAKDPNDRYRTAEEMHADIARELRKAGGPMPAAKIGYLLRKWFAGEPDVPDIDPALDEAMDGGEAVLPAQFAAPDLDTTLSELDRLLGDDSSTDLFQLPEDLAAELDELEDGEPFEALTPIPDLALSSPDGEALLMDAMIREPESLGLSTAETEAEDPLAALALAAESQENMPAILPEIPVNDRKPSNPTPPPHAAFAASPESGRTPGRRIGGGSSTYSYKKEEVSQDLRLEKRQALDSTEPKPAEPHPITDLSTDLGKDQDPPQHILILATAIGTIIGTAIGLFIGYYLLAGS